MGMLEKERGGSAGGRATSPQVQNGHGKKQTRVRAHGTTRCVRARVLCHHRRRLRHLFCLGCVHLWHVSARGGRERGTLPNAVRLRDSESTHQAARRNTWWQGRSTHTCAAQLCAHRAKSRGGGGDVGPTGRRARTWRTPCTAMMMGWVGAGGEAEGERAQARILCQETEAGLAGARVRQHIGAVAPPGAKQQTHSSDAAPGGGARASRRGRGARHRCRRRCFTP